jgi:transcriptional regulator with XRE-family HTH domain
LTMLTPEMHTRLRRIGKNLQIARKRRKISVQQAAEKMGTSLSSVRRMELGDPSVRVETYLAALEVYQLDHSLRFAEPEDDRIGLALEKQRLPQRIRSKKEKRLDF